MWAYTTDITAIRSKHKTFLSICELQLLYLFWAEVLLYGLYLHAWMYAGFLQGGAHWKNIMCPFSSNIKYYKSVIKKKNTIYGSDLFNKKTVIHISTRMCFCLFISEKWIFQTADTYLGKLKTASLGSCGCLTDKSPSLFTEFLNSLNFLNTFY